MKKRNKERMGLIVFFLSILMLFTGCQSKSVVTPSEISLEKKDVLIQPKSEAYFEIEIYPKSATQPAATQPTVIPVVKGRVK